LTRLGALRGSLADLGHCEGRECLRSLRSEVFGKPRSFVRNLGCYGQPRNLDAKQDGAKYNRSTGRISPPVGQPRPPMFRGVARNISPSLTAPTRVPLLRSGQSLRDIGPKISNRKEL
jgi:hypothetical protein